MNHSLNSFMKFLLFLLFIVCQEIIAQDFLHESHFLSDSGHVVWLTKNQDSDFDLNCKMKPSGFIYGTSYYQGTDSINKLQFLSIPIKNPKFKPYLLLEEEDTIWENIEKYKHLFGDINITISEDICDVYLIRHDNEIFRYIATYNKADDEINLSPYSLIPIETEITIVAIKEIGEVLYFDHTRTSVQEKNKVELLLRPKPEKEFVAIWSH